YIIDVSNPTNPSRLSTYTISSYVNSVSVVDGLAYVAGQSSGLKVIDVSDPARPFLHSAYDAIRSGWAVSVVDNLIYVTGVYDGLLILRIH
ncbi:MAG: hypothetical protein WAU95_09405, partial [Anaerolineae bacterium]